MKMWVPQLLLLYMFFLIDLTMKMWVPQVLLLYMFLLIKLECQYRVVCFIARAYEDY